MCLSCCCSVPTCLSLQLADHPVCALQERDRSLWTHFHGSKTPAGGSLLRHHHQNIQQNTLTSHHLSLACSMLFCMLCLHAYMMQ